MKFFFLSLVLAVASSVEAREQLVSCQIQNFSTCGDCETRVRADCVDHEYIGSLPLSLKPAKIQWQVTNSANGTERRVTLENKGLTLKEFKTAKSLKALAAKTKLAVQSGETVSLVSIEIPALTPLYKANQGKEVAVASMKPLSTTRSVASLAPSAASAFPAKIPLVGGVRRAQQSKEQK